MNRAVLSSRVQRGVRSLNVPVQQQQQQRRRKTTTTSSSSSGSPNTNQEQLLEYAIHTVKQHDAAAYLPGRLLADKKMQSAYFAVRAFWVETGLRFGSTANVPPNSTPCQHLAWWQEGIDHVFRDDDNGDDEAEQAAFRQHPVLQLLKSLKQEQETPWAKQHFDDVLAGRLRDVGIQQYETVNDLIQHAEQSCGSLSQLVLESGNFPVTTNPVAHQAAVLTGICHGLTNQLRNSIPVLSVTGKLVVPAELTIKYGIRSPRYLLSALSMGSDETCIRNMRSAVQEIAETAIQHLEQARDLRDAVLAEPGGAKAATALLPAIPSETFLIRLKDHNYQLTDRNLRHTGWTEHATCAAKVVAAYYQSKY